MRQSASNDWKNLLKENPKLLNYDIVETPNFISAYKELASLNLKEINSKVAFRLYDTFGLDEESITKLSKTLDLKFDSEELFIELESARMRSKENTILLDNKLYRQIVNGEIPKTDDSFKYFYSKDGNNNYVFKDIDIKVLKIYDKEVPVEEIQSERYCTLLLDKTNLYSEAGGQVQYESDFSLDKNYA